MYALKIGLSALCLLAAACPVAAAEKSEANGASSSRRSEYVSAENTALKRLQETASRKSAADAAGAKASTPYANSFRAYAPSCLHYPLPGPPANGSTPVYTSRILLAQYPPDQFGNYGTESVTARLWRIPCSSSGEFYDAVTVLALDRDASMEGNANRYPLYPGVRITQGNNDRLLARVVEEPNTFVSLIFADEPLIDSNTFVLENFPTTDASTARWDYNNAFRITFLNFFNGDNGQSISLPAYNPTQTTYPDAFTGLPISGYLTGNWFDEAHSGEGMLVQTFDLPNDQLLFTFAWFTYGSDGRPFWMFGSTPVARGTRGSIVVPTIYQTGGGFAGQFGPSAQTNTWGTVRFNFDNCYKVTFQYNSTHSAQGVPRGSGEKTWTRPVDTNGLTCE